MTKGEQKKPAKKHTAPERPLTAKALVRLLRRNKKATTLEDTFQSAGLKFVDSDIDEFFGALSSGLHAGEIMLERSETSAVVISAL